MIVEKVDSPVAVMSRNSLNNEARQKALEAEIDDLMKEEGHVEEQETKESVVKEPDEEPVSAEDRSFKKRYGDLRRHAQKEKEDLIKELEDLKKQIASPKTGGAVPKTKEQVEEWMKQYPDVAGIVVSLARQESEKDKQDIAGRLAKLEKDREQLTRERAEMELSKLHPDFSEIRDSDAFHNWAEEQPSWVQNALYEEGDVKAVSRAIDLYKSDMGIKTKKPTAGAAASIKSPSRAPENDDGKPTFKESQVNRMSTKEYEKAEVEILKAMKEGRFVYDLS